MNGDFESLELQMHEAYRSGADEVTFDIHATIQNRDGSNSVSEYQFLNASVWMTKGPNWTMGEDAKLSFEFECDDCVQVA